MVVSVRYFFCSAEIRHEIFSLSLCLPFSSDDGFDMLELTKILRVRYSNAGISKAFRNSRYVRN